MTGDIMYDTYLSIADRVQLSDRQEEVIVMTWHRQENTCSRERMESILNLVERLDGKVICPLHPRTRKCLVEYGLLERAEKIPGFEMTEPIGYTEMVKLMNRARLILTDSGGLSKESSFAGAKCLFMLDMDIWEDLVKDKWLYKFDPENEESVEEALRFAGQAKRVDAADRPRHYGDGHAAAKMVQKLKERGMI